MSNPFFIKTFKIRSQGVKLSPALYFNKCLNQKGINYRYKAYNNILFHNNSIFKIEKDKNILKNELK